MWSDRLSDEQEENRAGIVRMGTALNAGKDFLTGELVTRGKLNQAQAEEYLGNALKQMALTRKK